MAKKRTWFWLLLGFLIGAAAGFSFFTLTDNDTPKIRVSETDEQRQKGFTFINPLLDCGVEFIELRPFKEEIQTYITQALAQKKITDSSVYFRQLNDGYWLGINEKELFAPASLLKIPIMIAALKNAETDPTFLQKTVLYEAPVLTTIEPSIKAESIQIGMTYTIEDLIRHSISLSDNEATALVYRNIPPNVLSRVYSDLNLEGPNSSDFSISIKNYTTFFRVLYNASYLSREMSEKALKIASESTFKNGIVAGVDPGTVVAHKFGERDLDGIKQLHDCGIVYYPDSPYALCVMTRGEDFDQLEDVIQNISTMVFNRVKKQVASKLR